MRGFKLSGVVAALALLLVVVPASASAATLVEFKEGEALAPSGAEANLALQVSKGGEECHWNAKGKLGTNPGTTVVTTASEEGSAGCATGWSLSGGIKEVAWGKKVKTTSNITLTLAGPCVYEGVKFKWTTKFEKIAAVSGTVKGKLNKAASIPTCEKKPALEAIVVVFDSGFEPFGVA